MAKRGYEYNQGIETLFRFCEDVIRRNELTLLSNILKDDNKHEKSCDLCAEYGNWRGRTFCC